MDINPNPSKSILAPYVLVKIGKDDQFVLGDGLLKNIQLTLSEGSGASNCRFTIYDPGRKYANKYFAYIDEVGGLTPVVTEASKKRSTRSSGATGSLKGFDANKVQEAIDFYLNEGFTPLATAAIIGSIAQESSFDPAAVGTDQGAEGTPGASEGILQWTFERKDGLPSTYSEQLEFSITEMNRDTPSAYDVFSDPDATEAEVREKMEDWIRWGDTGDRWNFAKEVLDSIENNPQRVNTQSVETSKDSVKEPKKQVKTLTGSQITVILGFNGQEYIANSYIHTSLNYDLTSPNNLVFGGHSAAWVMTQQVKNTAYINQSLRDIFEKMTSEVGLNLDMPIEGSTYAYFPQRSQTDYDALLTAARDHGLRVQTVGNTVKVDERKPIESNFVLEYGVNLGDKFTVDHSASTGESDGSRSSDPAERSTSGQKKFTLEPLTGTITQEVKENSSVTGIGLYTTGSNVGKTKGKKSKVDKDAEKRVDKEKRIKGIKLSWSTPCVPESLILTPDSTFTTKGFGDFLDRRWTIESVTHSLNDKGLYMTEGSSYSPLKAKITHESGSTSSADGFTPDPGNFVKPTNGQRTSPFGMRNGRMHTGVDISTGSEEPVWASKDGTVSDVVEGCVIGDLGCGGGYGNLVEIDHGDGYSSLYAHLRNGSITVSIGDEVSQGDVLGNQSDTGHSYGIHLHHEIRLNNEPLDPEQFYTI